MARRRSRGDTSSSLLPGYTDLSEIGGGAFATVFRAREVETGREVALKVLKLDTVHPHLVETFQREIQALAKVSDHPNIVTLYRPLQTPDGRPVLVLELCRHSLSQQIRTSGPLSAEEATRVGIKTAGALETAHRSGFLHRDMKPQNILITSFSEPALADFGVAALQASAQATVGVFGFTTLHAAPEMLEGHHLSPATDVYGLASTMYQLLAGRAPFSAFENEAPASVILRILRDPVRPLYSDGIPLALSDLLEAALSKEPERRPRTALEFAAALKAVEAAEGWGATEYVVWGDAEWSDTPAKPPRPVHHSGTQPVPGQPAGDPPLFQSAPSVRVAGIETPGRPSLPPLLPPADTPGEAPVLPTGPARPAVTPPAAAVRNVVPPSGSRRGQPTGQTPPPEPLAPLSPVASRPARPIFVDPSPEVWRSQPAPESVYEQTMTADRLPGVPRAGGPSTPPSGGRSLRELPPLVAAVLGLAVAVVAVAVLLAAGVI